MNGDKLYKSLIGPSGKIPSNRTSENFIRENYAIEYKDIIEKYKSIECKFTDKVMLYIMKLDDYPICEKCNKNRVKNYNITKKEFNRFCSKSCSNSYIGSNLEVLEKKRLTSLERYGVEHHMKDEKIKEKIINTWKDGSSQEKRIAYNIKKYGVKNVMELNEVKTKKNETTLFKYGVEHSMQSLDILKKAIETNNKKYGVDYNIHTINSKKSQKANKRLKLIEKFKTYGINIINDDNIDDLEVESDCVKHKTYRISYHNLHQRKVVLNIEPCTECNPIGSLSISAKQIEVEDYIKNLKIDNIVRNYKDLYEIDIFLPDYNIGIEFNGVYWHSDVYKNEKYHKQKTEYFKDKNIQIIHIWEDDWIIRKDIIKSIIKSKLNKIENKYYARKLNFKKLDISDNIKIFYDNNHLQGYIAGEHYALLDENQNIISAMSFGKSRFKNKEDIELLRFCSLIECTVVGGFSKLLNNYIKTNKNIENIVSYANRDISNAISYIKNGFEFMSYTEPGYFYIKDFQRYNRFKFRKSELIKQGHDKNKTEFEIMDSLGYYRIWNSGNIKLIYKNTKT